MHIDDAPGAHPPRRTLAILAATVLAVILMAGVAALPATAAPRVDGRQVSVEAADAQQFLQQESRWAKHPCRFDVIAVEAMDGDSPPRLTWLKNAFDT